MKKKLISVCLTFAMVALMLVPAAIGPVKSYAASFTDTSGHWAETYIEKAVNQGIVNGYPDGTFLPDNAVSRAEFSSMLNKALKNTGTASIVFSDVPSAEWYYSDISKAVAATYVAGYDDNTFKPNASITRQEASVMIARIIPAYGSTGSLNSFGDSGSVADWATTAMQKVNGKGYIGAYDDGLLHPLNQLTRAQTAKIICDITDKETIVTSDPIVKTDGTKLSGKIYSNGVTIHKDLDSDDATIDNCVILGALSVQGGDTITVSNSRVASCNVSKSSDDVTVLAKGEVFISNTSVSNTATLQTSSLAGGLFGTGFNTVQANSSSDLTLAGTFPTVNVTGSSANVKVESGTITNLNVASGGRNSAITIDSKSTVSTANVDGVATFHGEGTITKMNANASGITYETKPKNWAMGSGVNTPTYADPELSIAYSPKNAATSVKVDIAPTITFSTAMTKYNGNTLTDSIVTDLIELRKKTTTGTTVAFSASINSAKKVITITPTSDLDEDTKYYIVIDKNAFKDTYGDGNAAQSIYFTTGDGSSSGVTFSPKNGATGVSRSTDPTIKFDSAIEQYSGSKITDSYIKNNITLRNVTTSKDITFTGSISSDRKTIKLEPDSSLTDGNKYTISFAKNKFRTTSNSSAIAAYSATWTVGTTSPVVSNVTPTPNETSIKIAATGSHAGTIYGVLLPSGSSAPNADQVIAGKNASNAATSLISKAVTASNSTEIGTFTGLTKNTAYTFYSVLKTSSATSAVKSTEITTAGATATVSGLTAEHASSSDVSWKGTECTVTLPYGTTSTKLTATAAAATTTSFSTDKTSYTTNSRTSDVINVKGSSVTTIYLKAFGSGLDDTIYTVNIKVAGEVGMKSITISGYERIDGTTYTFLASSTSADVTIVAVDANANITSSTSANNTKSLTETISLVAGTTKTISYTISSNMDTKTYSFTITVLEAASENP